jgi:type IV pilus assembly protein PilC
MLTYLVPQFASMFEENGGQLPAMTQMVLDVSGFLQKHYIVIIVVLLVTVIVFMILYKKVLAFRKTVQIILMHIPLIKNVIIYNEISNFTKTFASLLNHGVFITDSMEILQRITNNEVYKEIINNCLTNLAKGDTVSSAFKGQWAIPIVAYEMIVTGEKTGQLGSMMEKVAAHFQLLHKNIIDTMKSMVEPLLIVFLAIVVGIILMSIIQPMFAIYDTVK